MRVGDAQDQASGTLLCERSYRLSRYVGASGEELYPHILHGVEISCPGKGQIFFAEIYGRDLNAVALIAIPAPKVPFSGPERPAPLLTGQGRGPQHSSEARYWRCRSRSPGI